MKEAQTDRCVLCHLAGPVVPRPRTVHVALCLLQRRVSLFLSHQLLRNSADPRSRRPLFRITKEKKKGLAYRCTTDAFELTIWKNRMLVKQLYHEYRACNGIILFVHLQRDFTAWYIPQDLFFTVFYAIVRYNNVSRIKCSMNWKNNNCLNSCRYLHICAM